MEILKNTIVEKYNGVEVEIPRGNIRLPVGISLREDISLFIRVDIEGDSGPLCFLTLNFSEVESGSMFIDVSFAEPVSRDFIPEDMGVSVRDILRGVEGTVNGYIERAVGQMLADRVRFDFFVSHEGYEIVVVEQKKGDYHILASEIFLKEKFTPFLNEID